MENKICIANALKPAIMEHSAVALYEGVFEPEEIEAVKLPCGCERCTKPKRRAGKNKNRAEFSSLLYENQKRAEIDSANGLKAILFTGPECERCQAIHAAGLPPEYIELDVMEYYGRMWLCWLDLAGKDSNELPIIYYPNGESVSGDEVMERLGITQQCQGGICEI